MTVNHRTVDYVQILKAALLTSYQSLNFQTASAVHTSCKCYSSKNFSWQLVQNISNCIP